MKEKKRLVESFVSHVPGPELDHTLSNYEINYHQEVPNLDRVEKLLAHHRFSWDHLDFKMKARPTTVVSFLLEQLIAKEKGLRYAALASILPILWLIALVVQVFVLGHCDFDAALCIVATAVMTAITVSFLVIFAVQTLSYQYIMTHLIPRKYLKEYISHIGGYADCVDKIHKKRKIHSQSTAYRP